MGERWESGYMPEQQKQYMEMHAAEAQRQLGEESMLKQKPMSILTLSGECVDQCQNLKERIARLTGQDVSYEPIDHIWEGHLGALRQIFKDILSDLDEMVKMMDGVLNEFE